MITVHHILCGTMHAPPNPRAVCHCLLLEHHDGLALVDTGLGMDDVRSPVERFGQELIDIVGFQFDEANTAVRRVEALGFRVDDVTDVVLTHADPDHTGGLADFRQARVHVSAEEHAALVRGNPRYLPVHFEHGPHWEIPASTRDWFGLEARPVSLGSTGEVSLVPLFGHTAGHCGVAVRQEWGWALHVGDAYYLRVELERDDHPVSQLAAARAVDDGLRRSSLATIRRLARDHGNEIRMFGYHDPSELPS